MPSAFLRAKSFEKLENPTQLLTDDLFYNRKQSITTFVEKFMRLVDTYVAL